MKIALRGGVLGIAGGRPAQQGRGEQRNDATALLLPEAVDCSMRNFNRRKNIVGKPVAENFQVGLVKMFSGNRVGDGVVDQHIEVDFVQLGQQTAQLGGIL